MKVPVIEKWLENDKQDERNSHFYTLIILGAFPEIPLRLSDADERVDGKRSNVAFQLSILICCCKTLSSTLFKVEGDCFSNGMRDAEP